MPTAKSVEQIVIEDRSLLRLVLEHAVDDCWNHIESEAILEAEIEDGNGNVTGTDYIIDFDRWPDIRADIDLLIRLGLAEAEEVGQRVRRIAEL